MTLGGDRGGRSSPCRKSSILNHGKLLPEANIAILGPLGVGKSALTVKYLTKRFITEYDPEMEDVFSRIDTLDHQEVVVNILDTCDLDCKAPERYLKWADAFVVVYSLTNRESFEEAQLYLERMANYKSQVNKPFPLFLIGNKLDLERYRQVSCSEGGLVAAKYDSCYFLETTAAEECNEVTKLFHQALRMILHEQERTHQFRTLYIADDRTAMIPTSVLGLGGLVIPKILLRVPADQTHEKDKRHEDRGPKFKLFNKGFKIF